MVTSSGYKYALKCVDACTKYTWTFPLKLKSEVYTTHTHFITLVETQFNTKVKVVQTDEGEEFQSMATLFTHKGIVHKLT